MASSSSSSSLRKPQIDPGEVQRGQVIGKGSFGKVYEGSCRGKTVAIKELHNSKIKGDPKLLADFKKEVATMSSFFHPNICLFMGACTTGDNFFTVSEYLIGGDVEKFLANDRSTSLFRRILMARDVTLAMIWLHSMNPKFIHRDLKTSNLLLDENGRVKVCDFGLSQTKSIDEVKKDNIGSPIGSPLWMAPEVMLYQPFDEKVDVYAFGIILWELATRKKPFSNHTEGNSSFYKFRQAIAHDGERPPIPEDLDPTLVTLMTRCWNASPDLRPDFESILVEIDNILIYLAIRDDEGRVFWSIFFEGMWEASWDQFRDCFCNACLHPSSANSANLFGEEKERVSKNIACLKEIVLGEKPKKNYVQIERFGAFLDWFGPADSGVMDRVREICSQMWFHGDISDKQAADRLYGKPLGTYLVRFSSTQGNFAISQVTDGPVIKHFRIEHQVGGSFRIRSYDSLLDLMRGRVIELRQASGDPNLRLEPCPGSRFQSLFNLLKDAGYEFDHSQVGRR